MFARISFTALLALPLLATSIHVLPVAVAKVSLARLVLYSAVMILRA